MKVNHSAIRGGIRFFVLTAFIASMIWRLYVIMKFGGSKVVEKSPVDDDDDDDNDNDNDYDGDDYPAEPALQTSTIKKY